MNKKNQTYLEQSLRATRKEEANGFVRIKFMSNGNGLNFYADKQKQSAFRLAFIAHDAGLNRFFLRLLNDLKKMADEDRSAALAFHQLQLMAEKDSKIQDENALRDAAKALENKYNEIMESDDISLQLKNKLQEAWEYARLDAQNLESKKELDDCIHDMKEYSQNEQLGSCFEKLQDVCDQAYEDALNQKHPMNMYSMQIDAKLARQLEQDLSNAGMCHSVFVCENQRDAVVFVPTLDDLQHAISLEEYDRIKQTMANIVSPATFDAVARFHMDDYRVDDEHNESQLDAKLGRVARTITGLTKAEAEGIREFGYHTGIPICVEENEGKYSVSYLAEDEKLINIYTAEVISVGYGLCEHTGKMDLLAENADTRSQVQQLITDIGSGNKIKGYIVDSRNADHYILITSKGAEEHFPGQAKPVMLGMDIGNGNKALSDAATLEIMDRANNMGKVPVVITGEDLDKFGLAEGPYQVTEALMDRLAEISDPYSDVKEPATRAGANAQMDFMRFALQTASKANPDFDSPKQLINEISSNLGRYLDLFAEQKTESETRKNTLQSRVRLLQEPQNKETLRDGLGKMYARMIGREMEQPLAKEAYVSERSQNANRGEFYIDPAVLAQVHAIEKMGEQILSGTEQEQPEVQAKQEIKQQAPEKIYIGKTGAYETNFRTVVKYELTRHKADFEKHPMDETTKAAFLDKCAKETLAIKLTDILRSNPKTVQIPMNDSLSNAYGFNIAECLPLIITEAMNKGIDLDNLYLKSPEDTKKERAQILQIASDVVAAHTKSHADITLDAPEREEQTQEQGRE